MHEEPLMNEDGKLKQGLISAFESLKAQYGQMAAMICDFAALRTTLLEKSLADQTRYAELFAEEMKRQTPAIASGVKVFDELIAVLKTYDHWLN